MFKFLSFFSQTSQKMRHSIFVSVPSYRDDLLEQTVKSLIDNMSNNHDITIGILDQSTNSFSLTNPIIKYIQVDPATSKGVGWARNKITSLVTNETFYYQIDSHALFDANWDEYLIDDYFKYKKFYNTKKIVLTSSCKSFKIDKNGSLTMFNTSFNKPIITKYTRGSVLSDDNKLLGAHGFFCEDEDPPNIIPAIYLHAGNLFSHIDFIKNVGIPPESFYDGEEIYLTLKSFSVGYKLCHFSSVHNYHYDYNRTIVNTNPFVNPVVPVRDLSILRAKGVVFVTNFIKSLPAHILNNFYKFSGVDFINNVLDERAIGDYVNFYTMPPPAITSTKQIVSLPQTNIKLLVSSQSDIVSNVVATTGWFEFDKYKFTISQFIKTQNPIVFDVGCNIGSYSIPIALKYPSSKIYAFEIQYPIFCQIMGNISLNHAYNIIAYPYAIGDKNCTIQAPMLDYNISINTGAYSLNEVLRTEWFYGTTYQSTTCTIKQKTLDSLDLPFPDIIKISACGNELQVLNGAIEILSTSQPDIILDVYYNSPAEDSTLACIKLLNEFNYTVIEEYDTYIILSSKIKK